MTSHERCKCKQRRHKGHKPAAGDERSEISEKIRERERLTRYGSEVEVLSDDLLKLAVH